MKYPTMILMAICFVSCTTRNTRNELHEFSINSVVGHYRVHDVVFAGGWITSMPGDTISLFEDRIEVMHTGTLTAAKIISISRNKSSIKICTESPVFPSILESVVDCRSFIIAKTDFGMLSIRDENESLTLYCRQIKDSTVTIQGTVNAPGEYIITPDTSLLEAIAMAKGMNVLGGGPEVKLIRGDRLYKFNILELMEQNEREPVTLIPGDFINMPLQDPFGINTEDEINTINKKIEELSKSNQGVDLTRYDAFSVVPNV